MKVDTKVIDATSNLVIVSVSGRVKSAYIEPLTGELAKLAKSPKPVKLILDVQDVDAIDSSGIGELIKGRTELTERGGRVVLLGSNSRVEMMIKLSGLINYFPVAATQDEAIDLLNRPVDTPPEPDPESEPPSA
jgi:anti-anti-sigma factor